VTLFDVSTFDLRAYLHRIGVEHRPARADVATLQEIALLHPCAIPFENLNPLLRRPVRLDMASIQGKLVRSGRGGWCFEHNLLLGTALSAIGYNVTGLSARVVWNVPPGLIRGRSHMVLHIALDGVSYVVDAGFGGPTPTAPLKLVVGLEQATPHEPFRLMPVSGGFLLEAKIDGTWKGLYSFDLQPQVLADYEIPNWYLCNHPQSHFLDRVVAARVERDRRYALRNSELAVHFPDSVTERRTLGSSGEIRQVLTDIFRITVPDWSEVDETLERLAGIAPATT
jgi:N-hydroxyarylamine O-acetyltransferase